MAGTSTGDGINSITVQHRLHALVLERGTTQHRDDIVGQRALRASLQ